MIRDNLTAGMVELAILKIKSLSFATDGDDCEVESEYLLSVARNQTVR